MPRKTTRKSTPSKNKFAKRRALRRKRKRSQDSKKPHKGRRGASEGPRSKKGLTES